MKKRLLFILTILSFAIITKAQGPYFSCALAAQNIDCANGINGQTGSLPSNNQGPTITTCGIEVHNGVWYSFVAGTPSVTLSISAGNCNPPPGGFPFNCNTSGLQSAVFSGCGGNSDLFACAPGTGASNTAPNTTLNFPLNGLTVGSVYHLLLDGNCNSVCDFSINTVAGSTTAPPVIGIPVLQPQSVCIGGTITISTPPVQGAGEYVWTLPNGTVLTGQGPSITYTPNSPADFGVISVTAGNGCFQAAAPGTSVITQNFLTPQQINETICGGIGTPPYVFNGASGVTSYPAIPGLNINQVQVISQTMVTPQGCMQPVTISLEYQDPPTISATEIICFGTPSQYGNFSNSGVFTIPGITPEGCSELTILDLAVINPIAVINPGTSTTQIGCSGGTATLNAVPHTGHPNGSVTYSWTGPGNIMGNGGPTVTVDMPGFYSLAVTEIVNLPPSQANPTGQQIICTAPFQSQPIEVTQVIDIPDVQVVQNATIDCATGNVQLNTNGTSVGACYEYTWEDANGAFVSNDLNPTISNTGTYTLTVVNTCSGCPGVTSDPVTVTGAAAPVAVANTNFTTVDCNNTMATLDATGSTNGATYTWTDANGSTQTGLMVQVTAGTYTLTVDNGGGCPTSAQPITINSNNTPPTASIGVSGAIDCNNGNATLTAMTNSGNPSYVWMDANGMQIGTGNTAMTNTPGTVTLTVTDANTGCPVTVMETVVNNVVPISLDVSVSGSIACNGSDVTLEAINISGANNPSFVWTDADGNLVGTTNPVTVSATGTYTVVVTDAGTGCFGQDSELVTGNTTPPTATVASTNNLNCNNPNTTLTATGTGGPNLSYEWFDASGSSVGVGSSIMVSIPGDFNVIVTNTDTGCNAPSNSINVSQNNNPPTATITGSPMIDCNSSSVTLDGTSSTGSGTLSYSWTNSNGVVVGTDPTYTATATDVGDIILIVTDEGNGCPSTNPASVTVVDNSTTVTATVTPAGNLSCTINMVNVEATNISGATNPSFVWTDENGMQIGTTNPIMVDVAGTYTVVITDAGTGCSSGNISGDVTGDTNAPIATASSSNDLDCNNPNTTLSASGSSAGSNITYEWFDGSGTSVGVGMSIMVFNPDDYNVVVTNTDNNCEVPSTSITVSQNNNPPTATITGSPMIDCNSSSVILDGTSSTGSGTLSYSWTNSNGVVVGTDPTYTATATDVGDIILIVTDEGNGCPSTNLASATVVDNSATVTATVTPAGNLSCDNNMISIEATNISGATNPSFVWTDENGMQIGTTNPIMVDEAGTYTVVITDVGTGCSSDDILGIVSGDADTPSAMVSSTNDLDCNNPTTTLSANGSSTGSNFTYDWFDASGAFVGTGISIPVSNPGDYNVVVTNTDNNCNTVSTSIAVAQDNTTPTAVITGNAALDCNTMMITLDGSSSTTSGTYTITDYEWIDENGNVVGTNSTLEVTNPGDYSLNIIQSNGCGSPVAALETVVDNTTTVSVEATVSGIITCDDMTSTLDVSNPQGATNPTYVWFDNLGAQVGVGASYDATVAGTYMLEITDPSSGCTSTATAIVAENMTAPMINAIVANNQSITCDITEVSLDGSGSVSGSNIEFNWTNSIGTSIGQSSLINVSTAGTYMLTILDTSNGCTNTASVTVMEETAAPIADAGAGGTLNCGQSSFLLDGSGSTTGGNISYEWFNASGASVGTGVTFEAQSAGDYTLVVTNDDTGCTNDIPSVASVIASTDVPDVGTSATNNGLLTCDFNTLTLTGSSTTAGVSMEWQDANGMVLSNSATLDVTTEGTYTFVVVDPNNGCPASSPVNVTEDILPPTADAGVDPTLTCNDNFVTLNGSGSTAGNNITYQWFDENGASVGVGVSVDVMIAGAYTLVVTNTDNGCPSTPDVVEVLQDADIPVVVATNTNIDCANPTATLDGTGSATGMGIEYAWINAAGATVSTDLVAPVSDSGMYQLMVSNMNNGCDNTSLSIEVMEDTEAPTIAAANATGQLTCNNILATLDGTGSSMGTEYEYAWMDSTGAVVSTDISFDVNVPGIFTFEVTNTTNGCFDISNPVLVTQNIETPMAEVAGNATLTCTQNESILDGTGSSSGTNFSYAWTWTDATGNVVVVSQDLIATVGSAGMYSLTVTNDDTGCQTTSASSVEILQDSNIPVAMIDSDATANTLTCLNENVLLDASASTPSGSLTYLWEDDMGNVLGTEATVMVSNPATVTLTIVDGNNNCDASTSFVVIEDMNPPTALIDIPTTLDCGNPISTLDGSMSSIGASITYQWLNAGIEVGTDAIFDTDEAGDYILIVTNTDNGCEASMSVILGENFEAPAIDAGVGSTITCLDSTATLNGSGSASSATITYEWTNVTTGMVVSSDPTNPNLDVTLPGDYTLTVFDSANGCSSTSTAITILEEVNLPQANAGMPQTITCTNDVLTLSGSGSDSGPNIAYQWTDPNGMVVSTDVLLTDVTIEGTYILQVTNTSTGCVNTDDVLIDMNVQAPTADAGNNGTLTCGTLSFTLDASANSSTGANYTYEWLDANENVVSTEITFDAGSAGDFTFVVTDMTNGCSSQDFVSIIPDMNSPSIDVVPSSNLLTCATDMITLDASTSAVNPNSTGTLYFDWSSSTGATFGVDNTIDISVQGTYTLTVTDSDNGCFATTSITIGEDVEAPMALINAASNATLVCGQDDLLLDASGSTSGNTTGDLEYTWFDENGTQVGTGLTYAATSAQVYTVEVLNISNGCTNQTTQEIFQDNNAPTLNATVQGDLTCIVDAVIIDATASTVSGNGTLSYEWLDPSGDLVGTAATLNATMSGAYTLTIVDSENNCSSTNSAIIVANNTTEPTAMINAINGQTILCDVPSLVFNGTNSTTNTSGTLSYEWFLNSTPLGTTPGIEVGEAGTLMLVVTDSENGCSNSTSMPIQLDANLPQIAIATPAVISCIDTDVMIDATGTTPNLEYLWTGPGNITNETSLTPTVDAPGDYILMVTNSANGCTATSSVAITTNTNPPAVQASAMNQFNCVTTEITLSGDGSAIGSNFSYNWTTSNGVFVSGTNTLSPVVSAPGTYTLEVSDNLTGCTATDDVIVGADDDVPTIVSVVTNEPTCFGDSDGSFAIESVTGGEAPYVFSIDGGNSFTTIDQFTFLEAGNYEVIVQDLNGCESTELITLDQPGELLVELGGDLTIQLGDAYTLDPQIVGGYDILTWSNCTSDTCQVATQNILPMETSQYAITLVDGNGCTASDMITVFVDKKREIFIPNIFTPNGDGQNDFFLPFAGQEVAKIHEFRIFSRWGASIYEKLDFDPRVTPQEEGWDGKFNTQNMNPQVFVYYVDVEFIDGRREVLRGDVALRR